MRQPGHDHGHVHGPGCGCAPSDHVHEPEALKKSEEALPGAKVFYRDRPMRELHVQLHDMYQYLYRRMMVKVREFIEKEVGVGDLFKAEGDPPPPRLLTPAQVEELRQIVRDHHDALIAGAIGPDALPPGVAQRLIDAGLLPQDLAYVLQPLGPGDLPPETQTMIRDAFDYGVSIGATPIPTEKRQVENLTFAEWKERPKRPPSDAEAHAIDFAQHAAASRIRGLGNRVAEDFTTRAIEADKTLRRRFEQTIRTKVAENIEKRETWRQLWSELGHASGDWSRDFARIAATEKMDSLIEGQAREIVSRSEGGSDEVRVAKQPNPDACKDCLKHYTNNGIPKIFLLSELEANGSNIGRKRAAWLPTLGPLHPWCACELIEVPVGWEFDENGDLVPSMLRRSDFEWTLRKSLVARRRVMTYGNAGDAGLGVRIADPLVREAAEEVVSRTPAELFTAATGLTLITTDHGRVGNALEEKDYAYWTGNEIRIQQTIDPARVKRVLEHEIGHSLNSWLLTKFGDLAKVAEWHDELWKISQSEGFVTPYAKMAPIENAAEVTRLYIYYRAQLRRKPRQFGFAHRAYRDLFR